MAGADCPVLLGLFDPPTGKSKVLLHSGLPSQLPRQSQLTTLTAIWPLQSLAFLENPDPRQYPRLGLFSPLRHSRYIGHNVARVFGGFTSSDVCPNSSPTKNSSGRMAGKNYFSLDYLLANQANSSHIAIGKIIPIPTDARIFIPIFIGFSPESIFLRYSRSRVVQ